MQRIAIPYNYIQGKLFVHPFNNIGLITSCAKINIRKDWKINILQHKYNILYFGKKDPNTERIPMRTLLARLLILLEGTSQNQKVDRKVIHKSLQKSKKHLIFIMI